MTKKVNDNIKIETMIDYFRFVEENNIKIDIFSFGEVEGIAITKKTLKKLFKKKEED